MFTQTHDYLSATASNPVTRLAAIERDEEGFFLDASEWEADMVPALALELGLEWNEERQLVVDYVREYYELNQSVPEARTLLKYLRQALGKDKATRRYLYQLFPHGYGQQACLIAGMRKPRKLMLDV